VLAPVLLLSLLAFLLQADDDVDGAADVHFAAGSIGSEGDAVVLLGACVVVVEEGVGGTGQGGGAGHVRALGQAADHETLGLVGHEGHVGG